METDKIFYSWQSALPNNTNRGFIEKALEKAVKNLRTDDSLKVEPVVDRDIKGVPGSPNISLTIFKKIDDSKVFVGDVSIIQKVKKRSCPNPNVLIELGYAIRSLSWERVLLVLNENYGPVENLPFDLK